MKLTPSQKKTVGALGKHTLISAGAGTGKTRVLVERVFNLVTKHSIPLSEILVLTFTEKAAGEIKQRLSRRFQEEGRPQARQDLESAAISTFHSFAARLLREHPVEAGVDPDFRVFENEEAELLKDEALDDCITQLFETASPVFRFFEKYGELAARESILHIYHTARQEGLSLSAYFVKWKPVRANKVKQFESEILQQSENLTAPISTHIDLEGWKKWLSKKEWSWDDAKNFDEWLKSCGRSPKLTPWKNFAREWAAYRLEIFAEEALAWLEQAAFIFEAIYAQKKQTQNGLDFDDLQVRAVELLKENTAGSRIVLNALRRQFKHIFVDEFQDTSYLQMEFVQSLMSNAEVFLVGDYKQSIYAFRGAEPRLFLETGKAFADSEAALCVSLADNFRSQAPVLDFANTFFARLWEEDGFPFDPLIMKKETAETEAGKPELIVIPASEEGDKEEMRLREGSAIAARIQDLKVRGVPYGDIAVLFSAMTHSALYEYALRRAGVPYVSVSGMSFYDQPEIRDLMSLLECLQNPLADVPLAALLRSPFVQISDETLFWLAEKAKNKNEKNPLSDGISKLREISEIADSEKQKLESFERHFQSWRLRKDATRLSDLLEEAVEKTGYAIWALAQPGGVRRYGHIRKFIQFARRQEGRGKLSIHGFLGLVRRLQFQEVRTSDTTAVGEDIQAVKLMTIHAAKGLEFPVVFIADLGRERNRSESHPVLAVPHEGFAIRVKNPLTGENERTYLFDQLDEIRKKRDDEERKRLFYVAVTRAENKLILSGIWDPPKKEKENYSEMASWMDWVMRARDLVEEKIPQAALGEMVQPVSHASSEKPLFQVLLNEVLAEKEFTPITDSELSPDALQVLKKIQSVQPSEFAKVIDLPVSAYVLFAKDPEQFWSVYGRGWSLPSFNSELSPRYSFGAAGRPAENLSSSSSELGSTASDIDREDRVIEAIAEEPGIPAEDAADFGTRMHRALEFLNWGQPEQSLETANLDKVFAGFSEARRREAAGILTGFFETDLFKDIRRSKLVRRELSFVLNVRRGLIDGVIDVLFQNQDGSFTVLDYKTAEGDAAKVSQRGYDLQIQIYALAAAKILKQPVTRGQVYFLKNHCAVDVPLDDFAKIEAEVNELQLKLLEFVKSRY